MVSNAGPDIVDSRSAYQYRPTKPAIQVDMDTVPPREIAPLFIEIASIVVNCIRLAARLP
jgi:hypothetical protein